MLKTVVEEVVSTHAFHYQDLKNVHIMDSSGYLSVEYGGPIKKFRKWGGYDVLSKKAVADSYIYGENLYLFLE